MKLNPFTEVAKLETLLRHGSKLLKELLHPENGFGGHLTLVTGPIGTGKTSLLLILAKKYAEAGFIVIYRGREAFELYRLKKWKELALLFAPANHVIKFKEHDGTTRELKLEVQEYENIKDLLGKVQAGKINVVYASKVPDHAWLSKYVNEEIAREAEIYREPIFWTELFDYALKTLAGRKVVIIVDEAHELFPAGNTGLLWHIIDIAKSKIADFRKYRLNLVLSTHDPSDLDWRINRKFDFAIYLRGAKTLKRLVWQRYTYKLDERSAFIEAPAEFGLIKFRKLKESRVILVSWYPFGRKLSEKEREERLKKYLEVIESVAAAHGGKFSRRLLRGVLGREFNKRAWEEALRELREAGEIEDLGRGVYKFVEGA